MIKILRFFLVIIFFVFFCRLFYLTVILGSKFRQQAEKNRIIAEVLPAPRGIIYDRYGQALTANIPYYHVGDKEISRDEFLELLASGEENKAELAYFRKYLFGKDTAHLLGYLGPITAKELAEPISDGREKYLPSDLVGRGGIEEQYESWLRGKSGQRLIETNIDGKFLREVGTVPAQPGHNLSLNIDINLQKKATELLSSQKGAVVVSNPQNGKILALVSSPSFDPNLFTYRRDEEKIKNLLSESNKPFLNRAISARFPPGSVFKLVTAIAGLEEGKIDSQTKIEDTGVLKVGKFEYSNWLFTQYGRTEGTVDLVKAIKRSNDIYFYKVGEFLGVEKLSSWAKKFGLNKKTGIDLPAEVIGIVPSTEWKEKVKKEPWFLGDTYHLAIGQGDLAVTPLELNMAANVIANGGWLCHPQVAKGKINIEKNCQNLGIEKKNIELVKEGMRQACIKGGTGFPFFNFKIDGRKGMVACKTGTAEFGDPQGRTHAWFTVFAPIDNPQISITVFLQGGGEGSKVAAPIAKEIMKDFFVNSKF